MSRGTIWERAEARGAPRTSWDDATRYPFWLDSPDRPAAEPPVQGRLESDLAIVGGGLSGLWAAVLAKHRDPDRDVVLLEGSRLAEKASGRNGGFLDSSLTHGLANGLARYPDELETLERLGEESFRAATGFVEHAQVDCGLELMGSLATAVEPHEVPWLAEEAATLTSFGHEVELLDRDSVQAEVASPLYLAGLWQRTGSGLVNPARLCWGLAGAAKRMGVRILEHTPVQRLRATGAAIELSSREGAVRARQVLLATSVGPGLVRSIRRRVVPVYDYVLVTEPLSPEQRRSLAWERRQGLSDCGNQFHYYRLIDDERILFGGYDAVYHYASRHDPTLEQSERSSQRLAAHFFAVFPQLEGVRFSHRWGGAIDTCSRFFAFYGTAKGGRVAYAIGHTGLGVGASRFGAQVALDLLDGNDTQATRLRAIRDRPMPFPPEPLRWAAIQLTRNRLAAADRAHGRRGLWLRALDRLGVGFDS